jgi:RNA polymerase sigma-70 factor (ECF subfamily)
VTDTSAADARARARFDALFAEHFPAVRAYAVRRGAASAADDVLSETFLVAWRRLDAVPADALPWLLGVARRVLANQRRGEARRGALVELLTRVRRSAAIVEPAVDVHDTFGSLGEAIASLSAQEREALLLVAWEELEPQRAARVVGCSAQAFRARLYRARRRLAEALDELQAAPAQTEATTSREAS